MNAAENIKKSSKMVRTIAVEDEMQHIPSHFKLHLFALEQSLVS